MNKVTNAELAEWLGRVEVKLDSIPGEIERATLSRMRHIERWTYIAAGLGAAGTSSGITALVGVFGGS